MSQCWFHLMFFIGAFLASSEGQDAYEQLSEPEKKGVDLALQNLNTHSSTQHHFRFFRTLAKSNIESAFDVRFIKHNFYAKATTCAKGTDESKSKRCTFRNDRPLIDCMLCYKTHQEDIQNEPKPYINCMRKPNQTEDLKKKREEVCQSMQYSSGIVTLLGSQGRA